MYFLLETRYNSFKLKTSCAFDQDNFLLKIIRFILLQKCIRGRKEKESVGNNCGY